MLNERVEKAKIGSLIVVNRNTRLGCIGLQVDQTLSRGDIGIIVDRLSYGYEFDLHSTTVHIVIIVNGSVGWVFPHELKLINER